MAEITGMAQWWKRFKIKIITYLQGFNHLDIDDSYIEYVICELKYDNNDILLLDVDKIAESAQCFCFDSCKMAKNTGMAQW